MPRHQISRRIFIATALATAAGVRPAAAQAWPEKPVRIFIGFGAGGVADVVTRLLAEDLRPLLGQPLVVENRPGGSGSLAAGMVARAEPDGHTLLGMSGTLAILPSVLRKMPIDVERDLLPISIHSTSPNMLVVRKDFPHPDVTAVVADARRKPEEDYVYASSGVGTTVHFMAGMLERAASIKMRHLPFRSSSDSLRAVLTGDAPLVFSSVNSALPFIQSGEMRALAIATAERSRFLAAVPTFVESGLPTVLSDTWFGLFGPAAMPLASAQKLSDACNTVMATDAMRLRLEKLGAEVLNSSPEIARTRLAREVRAYAELAAQMKIAPE